MNQPRNSSRLLAALLLAVLVTADSARAAIVTYAFSGTHQDTAAPEAADVLAGYEIGDPFSGTLTFDTGATGAGSDVTNMSYSGHLLGISVLFDNTHFVSWTAPAAADDVFTFNPGNTSGRFAFQKNGLPEQAFATDGSIFATQLFVYFRGNDASQFMPLANFDPLSPVFDLAPVLVTRIHGPSLVPGENGSDTTVFHVNQIQHISLVPEPGSFGLAGLGLLAPIALARRRPRPACRLNHTMLRIRNFVASVESRS